MMNTVNDFFANFNEIEEDLGDVLSASDILSDPAQQDTRPYALIDTGDNALIFTEAAFKLYMWPYYLNRLKDNVKHAMLEIEKKPSQKYYIRQKYLFYYNIYLQFDVFRQSNIYLLKHEDGWLSNSNIDDVSMLIEKYGRIEPNCYIKDVFELVSMGLPDYLVTQLKKQLKNFSFSPGYKDVYAYAIDKIGTYNDYMKLLVDYNWDDGGDAVPFAYLPSKDHRRKTRAYTVKAFVHVSYINTFVHIISRIRNNESKDLNIIMNKNTKDYLDYYLENFKFLGDECVFYDEYECDENEKIKLIKYDDVKYTSLKDIMLINNKTESEMVDIIENISKGKYY